MTTAQCSVDDCRNLVKALSFCGKHYWKYKTYGNPLASSPSRSRTCSLEGCENKHWSSGYCAKHHARWKRTGNPEVVRRQVGLPVEERFWSKVRKGAPDECWFWISPQVTKDGYGMFTISGHNDIGAHRFAYELLREPIPEGLTIDHLCRNILCMNPAHMEPVTNGENLRRLWKWRKETGWRRQHANIPL